MYQEIGRGKKPFSLSLSYSVREPPCASLFTFPSSPFGPDYSRAHGSQNKIEIVKKYGFKFLQKKESKGND